MRNSAAEITTESRVVKAVLHGDYQEFPAPLRQLIELAPLGFDQPEDAQIMAAYKRALSNGGILEAYLEGDFLQFLELYRTSQHVEKPEDVMGDVRRLLKSAVKRRLTEALADIEQSPSQAWEIMQRCAKVDAGSTDTQEHWTVDQLLDYDIDHDPNAVIGLRDGRTTRYLCKGFGAWVIGQSGTGKSSLAIQQGYTWALGRDFFGVAPVIPPRILVVQNENDKGDCAEAVQGVAKYLCNTEEDMDMIRERTHIIRCRGLTGGDFIKWLQDEVLRFKADIAYVDPLLRFAGIEVSRQDQCTKFLNELIDPMLKTTGVILNGCHHTGKPKAMRETKGWSTYDMAYSGIGSSELVNWARAISILTLVDEERKIFELRLAKRGFRAWATHPTGEQTIKLFLKHSSNGLFWEQVEVSEVLSETEEKPGRPKSLVQQIASMNLHSFCAACSPDGESKREIARRLEAWLSTQNFDGSVETCRKVVSRLVETQKLVKLESGLYTRGPQA